jgi:hypothetical protein
MNFRLHDEEIDLLGQLDAEEQQGLAQIALLQSQQMFQRSSWKSQIRIEDELEVQDVLGFVHWGRVTALDSWLELASHSSRVSLNCSHLLRISPSRSNQFANSELNLRGSHIATSLRLLSGEVLVEQTLARGTDFIQMSGSKQSLVLTSGVVSIEMRFECR